MPYIIYPDCSGGELLIMGLDRPLLNPNSLIDA